MLSVLEDEKTTTAQSATTETETVKKTIFIVWIYDHEWTALFRDLFREEVDFERS